MCHDGSLFRRSLGAHRGIARRDCRLPFNRELAAGTLAPECFRFYITQDALYLAEYARVLAIAAAKAPDAATVRWFSQAAGEAVAVEQALHARYLARFGVDPTDSRRCRAVPRLPRLYELSAGDRAPATLGGDDRCDPAVFLDLLGRGRRDRRGAAPDNPYRAWIDTYADPRFGEAVQAAIAIADRAAETASPPIRDAMLAAFARSAQYEYLFWDGAYRRRGWPAFE